MKTLVKTGTSSVVNLQAALAVPNGSYTLKIPCGSKFQAGRCQGWDRGLTSMFNTWPVTSYDSNCDVRSLSPKEHRVRHKMRPPAHERNCSTVAGTAEASPALPRGNGYAQGLQGRCHAIPGQHRHPEQSGDTGSRHIAASCMSLLNVPMR